MREENYEALYRSLYQQNRDAVIYFNKTTIIDANQAALDLFEATIDEFIGKEIYDYTGDRAQALERAEKRLHGIPESYNSEIQTGSGLKEIEVVSTPVNAVGVTSYSIIRDVTEKNQLERRYKEIFEQSADLILITNASGVVFINPSGLEYLGLSSEDEIIGKSTLNFIHPDYRDMATLYAALRRAGGNPPDQYRSKMVRKDGEELDVEFKASYIDWGGVPSSITIVRDMRDQVKLEEELRKSEAEKQVILNAIPDSITLRDLEYNLIWVNQKEKDSLGLTDDKIIGEKCYEIRFNRGTPCDDCQVSAVLSSGKGSRFIKELPGGRYFEVIVEPVFDEFGKIASFLEMARDITWQIQSEREIRESEERLSGFIEAATDGFSILDSEMRYLMVNDTELEYTGRTREDYLGKHLLEVFPDLAGTDRYLSYLRVLETGEPVMFRKAMVLPERNLIIMFSAFKAGDILGIVAKDVTEQVMYQKRLEALHGHAASMSSAETMDEVARITLASLNEVQGFHSGGLAIVEGDHLVQRYVWGSGSIEPFRLSLDGPGVTVETVNTGKTQNIGDVSENPLYVEGWPGLGSVSELAVPVIVSGKTVGVINIESRIEDAFSEDDQRLVETLAQHIASAFSRLEYLDKLRASELRLSALHQHSLSLNLADSTREVNDRTLEIMRETLGYEFGSVALVDENELVSMGTIGEPLRSTRLPLDGPGLTVQAVNEARTVLVSDVRESPGYVLGFSDQLSELVVPIIISDVVLGVLNVESPHLNAFTADDARLTEVLAQNVGATLTRLRVAEDKIELERQILVQQVQVEQEQEMGRLKTRFMSTATHEIRTPLSSIQGYAELIQLDDDNLSEAQHHYFEVIQRNVMRLTKLTEDLLDVQQLDEGRTTLNIESVDILGLVEEVRSEFRPILGEKHQTLEVKIADVTVGMDRLRVMQVLVNLLSNASKFSPDGSVIVFEVVEADGGVQFSVTDHGIGISDEDHGKLFSPFPGILVEGNVRGTGLGLSICKGIVELHNGRIWAESRGLGEGSKFTFTLPVAAL